MSHTVDDTKGANTLEHSTSMENNQEEIRKYHSDVSTSLSGLTGQIQGIQVALQGLGLSDGAMIQSEANYQFVTRNEAAHALEVLNEHDQALKQCLKFVAGVFPESATKSGVTVGEAMAFNEAKQFIGNVGDVKGGPDIKVVKMTARDKAWQLTGNMTGDFASNFFK